MRSRWLGTRVHLLILAGLCGCGPHAQVQVVSAVERGVYSSALRVYREQDRDPRLLRAIAETMLLTEARRRDLARQRAAFTELGLLGTRARPYLEELAEPREKPAVRARALYLLMVLGDADAREQLRALLNDSDADVADIAYAALDPARDWTTLQAALRAARAGRRLVALMVLIDPRSALPPQDSLAELADASRLDPEVSVRVAVIHVLERFGPAAGPALERALEDADESVRVSAIEALARAAPERALPLLDRQLGAATSQESLAAALGLLRMRPPRLAARAWDGINRALSSGDPSLRARAATLLRSLPEAPRDLETAHTQLAGEPLAQVKLALALALGPNDPPAREALVELAQGPSLPAAQAAFELARNGDRAAQVRLLAARYSSSIAVRASVARLLGRELDEPQAVAELLADRESEVRVAAAGAVLAALSG